MSCDLNFGLYLDKLLGQSGINGGVFTKNAQGQAATDELRAFLSSDASWAAAARVDDRIRRIEHLAQSRGGEIVQMTATSRFVTGIGGFNPFEIGFHVDWTSGWPTLPGTGVKGAVRAWVEQVATLDDLQPEDCSYPPIEAGDLADFHAAVFGAGPEGDDPGWAGEIDFLDAIFDPDSRVRLDVLTPHQGPFEREDFLTSSDPVRAAPADWHDPVPLPYLVVETGATLHAGILPRIPEARDLAPYVKTWMKRAASDIGFGARTAKAGKGRFA